jgi:alkaline phosphatase D
VFGARLIRLVSPAVLVMSVAPSGLGPAAPVPGHDHPGLLVTVGDVSADRAVLWARGDGGPIRLRYGPETSLSETRSVDVVPEADRDHTARVVLDHLTPHTRYGYTVEQPGAAVEGTFTTAPATSDDVPVRLLWSGDLGGSGHCRDVEDGYRIFQAMVRRQPDFFLFVGDTVYADRRCTGSAVVPGNDFVATTLPEFHAKHRYNRADTALQTFFRSTSVFAIWDDHEVRNNFSGASEPLMPVARQAFLDYWPVVVSPEEPTRLYRRVRWGRHVDVFILDTRQYRSANTDRDGPDKSMLGPAQRQWLLEGVSSSDATWKLIVTSVPLGMFTGGSASDSWSNANLLGFRRPGTGFVQERDDILRALRDARIRNVVFVSGDVHHAEVLRHTLAPGYAVHELVAGPLAARAGHPRPLDRSLSTRSLGGLGWVANFGEMVAERDSLSVRIYDVDGAARVRIALPAGG